VIHPLVTFHVPTGLPPQGVTVPHAPGLAASLLEPSLPESSLPLEPPSLKRRCRYRALGRPRCRCLHRFRRLLRLRRLPAGCRCSNLRRCSRPRRPLLRCWSSRNCSAGVLTTRFGAAVAGGRRAAAVRCTAAACHRERHSHRDCEAISGNFGAHWITFGTSIRPLPVVISTTTARLLRGRSPFA